MASAMMPAVIVCCFVFMCPESPRWYISKNRHSKAWNAIQRLRYNKVQAARDLFYIQFLVKAEMEASESGQNKIKEMITVPRNRRALIASEIVMFMQQVMFSERQTVWLVANMAKSFAASTSLHTTAPPSSSKPNYPNSLPSVPPWALVLSTFFSPSPRCTQSTPSAAAISC